MTAAKSASVLLVGLLFCFLSGGCTMCPDCGLEDYGAYGGRWQRTVRDRGRVGSVFDPAGAQVPYGLSAVSAPDSVLEDDESTDPQESDADDNADDSMENPDEEDNSVESDEVITSLQFD